MKLKIKLEIAHDKNQVPEDPARPYSTTLRFEDVYEQSMEITNDDTAVAQKVHSVIKAFNGFTQ